MLAPLREAVQLLTDAERDRVLVLVTDGQVGNEDHILADLTGSLSGVRVHTVGIDRAVNAGFLGRLAGIGAGRCELVESEERLDEALDRIHRRIGTPLLTDLGLSAEGVTLETDTISPTRMPDAFAGVPLVIRGRYRDRTDGAALRLHGTTASGEEWQVTVPAVETSGGVLAPVWARGHLRDLEDRYAAGADDARALERRIVATSLRHQVLCRFTALVAVDSRVVTEGGPGHRVIQPVELPSGWDVEQFSGLAAAPMAPGGPVQPTAMLGGPGLFRASSDASTAGLGSANLGFAARARMAPSGIRRSRGGRLVPTDRDFMADARTQMAAEASLLRAAGTPSAPILADLASRLDALVRYLGSSVEESVIAPIRELVTALQACEGPTPPRDADLDALWHRALTVLDALAGGSPSDASASTSRQAFWKR